MLVGRSHTKIQTINANVIFDSHFKMNKNETTVELSRQQTLRTEARIGLIKYVLALVAGLVAIKLILDGLQPLVVGQSPEAITALAAVIREFHLGSVLGYLWGAGATAAWTIERKGKKRAIQKKSEYQSMVESGEPNRSSSGLTPTGDTPAA